MLEPNEKKELKYALLKLQEESLKFTKIVNESLKDKEFKEKHSHEEYISYLENKHKKDTKVLKKKLKKEKKNIDAIPRVHNSVFNF